MKKIVVVTLSLFLVGHLKAQDPTIGQKIDQITYDWDREAEMIETYDGLSTFCKSAEYRNSVISILNEIHHYDSVLYDRAVKASKRSNDKEIKKLMKDIENLEEKYSMKAFLKFLSGECKAQKGIEKDSKNSKKDSGAESYDSQVYMLEIELQKYVKHITKNVDLIRKHIHHLGVE